MSEDQAIGQYLLEITLRHDKRANLHKTCVSKICGNGDNDEILVGDSPIAWRGMNNEWMVAYDYDYDGKYYKLDLSDDAAIEKVIIAAVKVAHEWDKTFEKRT